MLETQILPWEYSGETRWYRIFVSRRKMPRTSDEYGMLLSNLLEQNSISHDDIEDAIIASVVPNVMHSLEGAIIKYFSIRPIIVEPGTKTGYPCRD